MKKVYLVLCNGIVSDEAYSTVEGALNFIANRYGAPKCLDDAKTRHWTYCFNDYVYQITDVSVADCNEQKDRHSLCKDNYTFCHHNGCADERIYPSFNFQISHYE